MAPESQPGNDPNRRSVDSLTVELLTVYEELSLLYSLAGQFSRVVDEDRIAAIALREAMQFLRADCGWVVLWNGDGSRLPAGCRIGIAADAFERMNQVVLEPVRHRRRGQVLSHAVQEDYHLDQPDVPARFLACPLASGEISQGYLCLGRKRDGRIFTSAEQKLINAVAFWSAAALENSRLQRSELEKQRLENEIELARGIQQSLLPQDFSCVDFVDARGVSRACYEIGGDYFDLLSLGLDSCLLVMADVCGKGPAAALQATRIQGIVHAVSRLAPDLPAWIRTLNDCILERGVQGSFVTGFLATVNRAGELQYINAGHNPPLWIQAGGRITALSEAGPVLGFLQNCPYPQPSIQLAPGDLLVLYTDGITDSENDRGESFGDERLLAWASAQAGRMPQQVEQSLMDTVAQFCGSVRQTDDLTLLVARYLGPVAGNSPTCAHS